MHFKARQNKNPQIRSKVVKQTKRCKKTRLKKRADFATPRVTSMLILSSLKMQTIINHQFMKTKHQIPKHPPETNIFLTSIKSNDNSSMFFCEQLPALNQCLSGLSYCLVPLSPYKPNCCTALLAAGHEEEIMENLDYFYSSCNST